MDKSGLLSLLKTATGGIFTHRDELYQQCDGVAMGNPLAPTLANFFMENQEILLFENSNSENDFPSFYVRYVDDVFCVFRKTSDYNIFLAKLNSLHGNVQFTHEMGGIGMPFLDTSVTLSPDGLKSSVYRKKTDTNVIMHYDAIAPNAWKTGLIKCMLHRAEVVCSDKATLEKECKQLKDVFYSNGYPTQVFDKTKEEYLENKRLQELKKSEQHETSEAPETDPQQRAVLKIPYVGKASVFFGRRLKRLLKTETTDIRIVYHTTKVGESFQLKDPVQKELLSRVVYQFTCRGDPDTTYIGFTNRTLKERFKEHVGGKTSVSDHIAQCHACNNEGVTIDDFKILKRCRTKMDTAVHEALLITEKNPSLNRQLVKPGGKQFTLRIFD